MPSLLIFLLPLSQSLAKLPPRYQNTYLAFLTLCCDRLVVSISVAGLGLLSSHSSITRLPSSRGEVFFRLIFIDDLCYLLWPVPKVGFIHGLALLMCFLLSLRWSSMRMCGVPNMGTGDPAFQGCQAYVSCSLHAKMKTRNDISMRCAECLPWWDGACLL